MLPFFDLSDCKADPFLITDHKVFSYEEFFQKVAAIANALGPFSEGRLVAFCARLTPSCIALILALLQKKALFVPLSPYLPQEAVQQALSRLENPVFLEETKIDDLFNSPPLPFSSFSWDLKQIACLLFTSGSTGHSKIAALSLGNFYFSALGSLEAFAMQKEECWHLCLPLFHVSGLSILFRTLLAKSALSLSNAPLKECVLNPLLHRFSLVPTQLFRLLEGEEIAVLSALRKKKSLLVGGAGIAISLWEKIQAFELPVFTTWGMTEMASQITMGKEGIYSAGKLLPYREVRLNSENELLVKGPCLFLGYYTKEEGIIEEKGYFATKDIGEFDEKGRLHIQGRKDLMFLSGGENIHPEEIESALKTLSLITDAVVVPIEDREWGKRPFAFIETKEPFDAHAIEKMLRNILPSLKIPVGFHPLIKKPHALKVNRKELEQIVAKLVFL